MVHVEQAPNGNWFASYMGWGRKFGTGPEGEAKARRYAETYLTGDDSKR